MFFTTTSLVIVKVPAFSCHNGVAKRDEKPSSALAFNSGYDFSFAPARITALQRLHQ